MQGFDFKIDLPEGWSDQTVYSFKGPTIDGIEHILYLSIDKQMQTDDVELFAKSKLDVIQSSLNNLNVLRSTLVTQNKGNPVYEFIGEWMPGDGYHPYKKYVFVLFDNRGFTFSLDFSKKTYKQLNFVMKKIINSFLPGTYVL